MITVQRLLDEYYDLIKRGYPLDEDTDIILDYSPATRRVILGFAFEDNGFKITMNKEICDDNKT